MHLPFYFFFFSSRRRHTRYWRDWSSDVCSSDLGSPRPRSARGEAAAGGGAGPAAATGRRPGRRRRRTSGGGGGDGAPPSQIGRASCRERVEISVGAVSLKKKNSASHE